MKTRFSENRRLGATVLAAAIVLSLMLSGGGGLMRERVQAEAVFYAAQNINTDLAERAEAAFNIWNASTDIAAESTLQRVEDAREALLGAKSIAERYRANVELDAAVGALMNELDDANLSAEDSRFVDGQYAAFTAFATTIARSEYNEIAGAFNAKLGAFPANLIGMLAGVRALEQFG